MQTLFIHLQFFVYRAHMAHNFSHINTSNQIITLIIAFTNNFQNNQGMRY